MTLGVYDLNGRLVESLVAGYLEAGNHTAVWEAEGCAAGVYYCRIQTEDSALMSKMILLR